LNLDKCIRGRRSIRKYKAKRVPKTLIEKILEAATYAPSGMNAQPWRFVVIEDRETIARLSNRTKAILLGQEWGNEFRHMLASEHDVIFYGAPLLILICVQKSEEWKSVNLLDCGLAAQNMFLKAHELGLGSCFIGFGNFLNGDCEALESVGIPADHELIAPLVFGYPAEEPQTKPRETKVLKWI
jgi:nitroreductase